MRRLFIIAIVLAFTGFNQLSAQVREIDANIFYYDVLPKMTKPIVLDFWAEWCGPCKRYTPTFMSVARKYKTVADFYRVNIDKNEEWCSQLKIGSIPTTIVVYNKCCDFIRREGVLDDEELRNIIDNGVKRFKSDDEPYF